MDTSLWGDSVYGYDFKWRDVKKSESQNDWNYNVRSVNNQRVIHRSTQWCIAGQENNDDNIEFEQCVELFTSRV